MPLQDAVAPDATRTAFPAVNSITLAGQTMAGRWTLTDCDKVFGWQIQKAFGLSGAGVFPIGDELVVAKFEVAIWTDADMRRFLQQRKLLLNKPVVVVKGTVSTKALKIGHPELVKLGVDSVVMKSISALRNDGTGLWTCSVEFLQFRAPVLASNKPSGVIPDAHKPQPTAQDAADLEEQRLRVILAKLAARP